MFFLFFRIFGRVKATATGKSSFLIQVVEKVLKILRFGITLFRVWKQKFSSFILSDVPPVNKTF